VLATRHYDYLIFGHRHLPIDFSLKGGARYINLGDWIRYYTYAVFDGQDLQLCARYPETENKIYRQ
jgi:UDP-2,3-diacylglucosamine hydrolase